MTSMQLEFPLAELIPLDERIDWLKKSQESDRELARRTTKKLFMKVNELESDIKEYKYLIRKLVDLLNKGLDE